MPFLALAILCSASIALVFRRSERTGANRWVVTAANYAAAVAAAAVLLAMRDTPPTGDVPLGARLDEIAEAVGTGRPLSAAASPVWGVLLGLAAGGVFFLGFVFYQLSVRDHGVGLAGSFAKLGILLPTSLSLILWREDPTLAQALGIGLAVLSIGLVHAPRPGAGRSLRPTLLLLFLFGGFAEFTNRIFQRHGRQEDRAVFLLTTFAGACVLSVVAVLVARRRVTARDLGLGFAVGVPNLFSSYFLIRALEDVPAVVAFPIYGAGTILILAVIGTLALGDRLTKAETLAVAATMAAMVLVQL